MDVWNAQNFFASHSFPVTRRLSCEGELQLLGHVLLKVLPLPLSSQASKGFWSLSLWLGLEVESLCSLLIDLYNSSRDKIRTSFSIFLFTASCSSAGLCGMWATCSPSRSSCKGVVGNAFHTVSKLQPVLTAASPRHAQWMMILSIQSWSKELLRKKFSWSSKPVGFCLWKPHLSDCLLTCSCVGTAFPPNIFKGKEQSLQQLK